MAKKFDREQRQGFWAACRVAFNRGRFELASEIEEQIKLASTVDADKLRAILYPELGSEDGVTPPTREQRNSNELDKAEVIPDYVQHRCTSAAGEVY